MTIINKSLYPVSSTLSTITSMHKKLESLQLQLASGNKYNTLAEMGSERVHDINLRNRLSRIEGYQSNILTVENRMSFYTNGLERLDEIEESARALAVPNAYGTDGINLTSARNQATNLLKEVIDVLNTDITGQFIFGGNKSDTKPVSSFDEIMNGPNGFVRYTQNRNDEDMGTIAGNSGRIDQVLATDTITLTEDGDHEYGFKIASVTTTGTAMTASAGPVDILAPDAEQVLSATMDAVPADGDTITIGLTLPHDRDTVQYFTFTATDTDPVPADGFAIGADAEETAANLNTAISDKLAALTRTDLRSSSTYAAADGFFNGMGEAQDPDANVWYNGQDSTNPRQTVSANIDENTKTQYGVQANESGFVELIKGLAVFSVSELSPLDEDNAARYDALVDIQRSRLSEDNNSQPGSIEVITMELGIAASTVNTVKERHSQYGSQLETMLAEISEAPKEEVAMMLLTLQTQLEASYQATAMASQLTLVNYL
ncbi:hypothetical protein [Pelagibacterium halotolerans]|uniref:Flagellin N-terminal domain-containing protein n=1 Tax=Pelagibacterium halotolerans (strain DSM 22347 / JCM 15775 / CGMCC 1.7692 / B2) TaxID=1082931 RepID=G4RES0_PELHB|nr:hypothetical protein [Pelagibacterium halotolerans]AEQ51891.1 hypothetical protein KKY_1880 [Pelagibacterium halotolerans B2]QJR18305.1 hypothetical protein HKM20_07600 [Pelagibacterium halotolerans]SEA26230.1 Flagellin FlgL [Pelagibacterium halotolerans]